MAVSRNCKNGPLSPMGGTTGPLWPPVAQATGDRDLSVIFFRIFSSNRSLTGDVVQGAGRPPNGRQGRAALFKPPSPQTPHSIL